MQNNRIIAARLTSCRNKTGMTQGKFADEVSEICGDKKISCSLISSWETGRRNIPEKYVDAIAEILGVTKEYLYGLTDDMTSRQVDNVVKISKSEIVYEDLCKYDRLPIYVEFTNYSNEGGWGIYVHKKNQIILPDFIFKVGTGERTKYKDVHFYIMAPDYIIPTINGRHSLDYAKMMNRKKVFVKMNTADPAIRNKYNGWYRHNEDHTALINAVGYVLPYDGLNVSYSAYSEGEPN